MPQRQLAPQQTPAEGGKTINYRDHSTINYRDHAQDIVFRHYPFIEPHRQSLIGAAELDIPKLRRLKKKAWMTAIESRAEDNVTWVLFRQKEGRVSGILVGALDDDELVYDMRCVRASLPA